jgi:DinB superfamily
MNHVEPGRVEWPSRKFRIKTGTLSSELYRAGTLNRGRVGLNSQTFTEKLMPISELLLPEFDEEMKKTRATLERVPFDKKDFAPHAKSMPLGKLAPHVAELAGFGIVIMTTPGLDFGGGGDRPRPPFESAGLLKSFDENVAKARAVLQSTKDDAWLEPWKLSFQGKPIFSGQRFLAYREMFLNHLVHHRAQLGVYLRLNDKPVPSTYGPSADDTMGF